MTIITVLIIIIAFAILIPLFVKYINLKNDIKELNKDLERTIYALEKPAYAVTIYAKLNTDNQIVYGITESDKSRYYLLEYNKYEQDYTSIEEAKISISKALTKKLTVIKESVDIETIQLQ